MPIMTNARRGSTAKPPKKMSTTEKQRKQQTTNTTKGTKTQQAPLFFLASECCSIGDLRLAPRSQNSTTPWHKRNYCSETDETATTPSMTTNPSSPSYNSQSADYDLVKGIYGA